MAKDGAVTLEISADVKEAVRELGKIKEQMEGTASIAGELRGAFAGIQQGLSGNSNAMSALINAMRSLESTVGALSNAFKEFRSGAHSAFEQVRRDAQEAAKGVSQTQNALSPILKTDYQGQAVNITPTVSANFDKLKAQAQKKMAEAGKSAGKSFWDNFKAENEFIKDGFAPFLKEWGKLDKAFAIAGGAVAGAIGLGLKKSLSVGGGFEAQMANVKVISGATGEQLAELTAKAREMGATLPITAQQAAAAMEVLAQRGTSVKDILASVTDVTNLAISQNVDLASAAELMGSTMTNFGLNISEASRVTDIFNNASNQSALSMSKLSTALTYVAPSAAAAGMSLEETVAAMEVLANSGLDGSMIGTSLSMALQKIVEQSHILGVRTKDAAGNMRPLKTIFTELAEKGMTLAQATEIFGARAAKAGLNLVKYANTLEQNEEALKKLGSTSAAVEEISEAPTEGKPIRKGASGREALFWRFLEDVEEDLGKGNDHEDNIQDPDPGGEEGGAAEA